MSHHDDRVGRGFGDGVQPLELLVAHAAVVVSGHRRVEQGDGQAVELDLLVARIRRLPADAVVVAANGEQSLAERRAIAALEGGELVIEARRREVAFGDHRGERRDAVDLDQLGDRRSVHHVRIRRGARCDAQDRAELAGAHAAGLGLAEVDVVDRGEPGPQPAGRDGERLERDAVVLVRRGRLEPVDDLGAGRAVERGAGGRHGRQFRTGGLRLGGRVAC